MYVCIGLYLKGFTGGRRSPLCLASPHFSQWYSVALAFCGEIVKFILKTYKNNRKTQNVQHLEFSV